MANTFPAEVPTFTVVGRFVRSIIDSEDVGSEPDVIPIVGAKVTFAPDIQPPIFRVPTAADPLSVFQEPIIATTDSDGYLKAPLATQRGIVLPWSLSPNIQPTGWSWRVQIEVGGNFPPRIFSLTGTSGGTVNLASVIPVPANPGAEIAQWTAVTNQVLAARDEAVAAAASIGNGGGGGGSSLPPGGTIAQILRKNSSTDGDASWVTLTKSLVGLANVDNTADADKPISNAQAAVNAQKAPLVSPAFSGVPTVPTAAPGTNNTQAANAAFVTLAIAASQSALIDGAPGLMDTFKEVAAAMNNDPTFATTILNQLALKAPLANPTFTGTVNGITKTMVGLGNVDNTSDAAKPVSTAQATAIGAKLDTAAAAELIRDTIGTALVAGTGISIVVDDAGDKVTITSTAGSANSIVVVFYDAVNDVWPSRPTTSNPVMWIATNDSAAPKPAGMLENDFVIVRPGSVLIP